MPAGCLQLGHVVRAVAGPGSHLQVVRGEDVGQPLKQQLRSAHVAARARLDQGSTPVLPRHRARRGGVLASGSARVRDCLEARSEPRPARGNVRLQSLH